MEDRGPASPRHEKAVPQSVAASASPAPAGRDPRRWEGVLRPYGRADVDRLRGSVPIEHTLARLGAERLWELMHTDPYVSALGALSGGQAVQMVKAGLKAIYLSGWQVAADANSAGQTYPDQSLYPADSVPTVVRRLNAALQRVDQIEHAEGRGGIHWFAPIVADAEAGFGGPLNAFELMKAMIEAGAAGVHFEDQVAAEKKCGHLGGKVLVPTSTFVRTLTAARLAADVMGVPTLLVARTDAESATLLMSDVDPQDAPFVDRSRRTPEGFYGFQGGLEAAIARGIAYAPYADVVWCETHTPDLDEARRFAEAIHAKHPGKLLAYNCSPSFNWRKHLDDATIARFQRELGAMGYKFQFVTLAGFHALNYSMFELASGYRERGMSAYSELQQAEFAAETQGYTATRHQREVGVGYFDAVATVISGGASSTLALAGSTEAAQFAGAAKATPPPATQVAAVFDDDHARLKGLLGRLDGASDVAALSASLDELDRMLSEHFADEEGAAGFYGLVGAKEPRYRTELEHLVEEHRRITGVLAALVKRSRGPGAARAEIVRKSGELASMLLAHEAREVELAKVLA
jgi:isocitrate lyase